jgi:hypothetical protein
MGSKMPEEWRKKVRQALSSGDNKRIQIRQRAVTDWSALFPELFSYQLLEVLCDALGDSELIGNQVFTMDEPGEVYEFIFLYKKRYIYSKLNLCPDGTIVIVYSAHRPLKGNDL